MSEQVELDEEGGDLECPEEHLRRNSCIIYTDAGKKYCPHYVDCDCASDKPWIYIPLK